MSLSNPSWLAEILDRLEPLNSISDSAEALNVPVPTLRGYVRRGHLQAVRCGPRGSRVLIPRDAIRDLLLDGLTGPEEVMS